MARRKRIERTDQIFKESELITAVFAEREKAAQRPIPLDSLVPNRFNPRQDYSKESLDELIQSMQEHGFIGALDGRELPDGRVELAYGSRRLLAARAAGIQTIPVFLHDWDDNELLFVSLVENLIREDLTPYEQAEIVGRMHEELEFSVREIARKTSKPKSWVEDRLALYRAPQDVKKMVAARPDTLRAASYISRIPDEETRSVLEDRVIKERVTARQVQQAVQQVAEEEVPVEEALGRVIAEVKAPVSARADTAAKEAERGEKAAPQSARGRPSPMRFLIQANQALASFDPEAVQGKELKELLNQLKQLIARANFVLEKLEKRLQEG